MKKIFFVAIGIACLMASCTKDSTIEQPKVNPFAGREVIFSTNADDNSSRTIYGDEEKTTATDGTITSWYYPVYWKKGDQILVYGKDSKTKATYDVNVDNDGKQNYATSLNKVEANGVQWGTNATSDFFAVYPAKGASFNEDGSINTKIAQTQYNVFAAADVDEEGNAGGWVGQPFDTDATNPTMTNAIMYAYTKDASAYELNEDGTIKKDTNGNPIPNQKVDLNFKPFSTVLKFRLAGFAANLETSAIVNVTKITITAPNDYEISGDFTITPTVTDGTVSATAKAGSDSQNTIEIIPIISTGTYLPITVGQYVEFNVFAMPIADQQILTTGNWTVKVETAMHGNYTCTLKPTANKTLAPGKIHKIAVPAITTLNNVTWDYSKWMAQIPPKVYLSELSVPGTWYSCNSAYQNTTSIATQYQAGIRAFNIDCRLTNISTSSTTTQLSVAGTDKAENILGVITKYSPGELVLNKLKDIAACIQPDEYVIVVLTIAEKPMTASSKEYGSIDPTNVIPVITSMLDTNAETLKIYQTTIDSDTTVEDVLGHMIVKINTNNATIGDHTYPKNALVSFASMGLSGYVGADYASGKVTDIFDTATYPNYYSSMQKDIMYWGNQSIEKSLTYYYHQAQRTTSSREEDGVASIAKRQAAIQDIIDKSTEIYDASDHNGWFQLGVGGYIKEYAEIGNPNQQSLATTMNAYVQELIEGKINTDPSPVGIVLMNFACDTNGKPIQLVKDIIDMNAKFYLKREGGDITTGGTDGSGSGSGSGNTEGGSGTGGETLPDN